jgi:hypothetical protein
MWSPIASAYASIRRSGQKWEGRVCVGWRLRLCVGVIAAAVAPPDVGTSAGAQTASPLHATARSAPSPFEERLRLCLGSWDPGTHMSKREWQIACRRTVKEQPDAYR